jgi:hypothetical protein
MIENIKQYQKLNPTEQKAFQGAVKELVDSLARVEGENSLQKEIADQQKEKFGISPADTKKAAKIIFKRSLEEERMKAEEFFDFVENNLGDLLK